MKTLRTALPVVLASSLLAGCASVQREDWPTCAGVGGVGGAALGALESSTYAGWGAVIGGGVAAAYCWARGEADGDGDGVPDSRDRCPDTAPGVEVDDNGCPPVAAVVVEEVAVVAEPQPRQETIVVDDLLFAFDSAQLAPQDRESLDEVISRLRGEAGTTRLSIVGHTDSIGSEAYNQKLSAQRAMAVADYLVSNGVSRSMIVDVRGAGESQPVADNSTERGRQLNRRVEINIER